ncbi:hypothetical protein Acr_10g0006930 [Actinidia rufa]|uniref:Uncharacterized protein n=1 Tax=Actinidia rufa TaxID=165716 RepID=A0A7J0F9C7_9ERIC|nr:hypothetical protein Acr_10g0006930 [Actinidia rufa]
MESERPEVEGFKVEMRAFMAQMSDSMKLLHTKVDNIAFRLMIVQKKMRNLTKEVQKGKIPMEEDESEEEDKEEEQEKVEDKKEEEEKEDGSDSAKLGADEDSSKTESDTNPIIPRTSD